MRALALFVLVSVFSSTAVLKAADPDDAAIDQAMEKFEAAFVAGDMTYAIGVMYSPVLKSVGGREAAIKTAEDVQAQMKAKKLKFVSWKAKKPFQYASTPSRRYAVVPYEGVVDLGGEKKLRQSGYQLAIKEKDGPWQFINGDNLTPEVYAQFFPDFPATLTLPKVKSAVE